MVSITKIEYINILDTMKGGKSTTFNQTRVYQDNKIIKVYHSRTTTCLKSEIKLKIEEEYNRSYVTEVDDKTGQQYERANDTLVDTFYYSS